MKSLFNIPEHKNCKNCGECCGLIPATMAEVFEIKKFLKENKKLRGKIRNKKTALLDCPFRNEEEKKCDIYEVRPMICRLFGVIKSDFMKCPHGNTHEIDGNKFLKLHSLKTAQLLNRIKW